MPTFKKKFKHQQHNLLLTLSPTVELDEESEAHTATDASERRMSRCVNESTKVRLIQQLTQVRDACHGV